MMLEVTSKGDVKTANRKEHLLLHFVWEEQCLLVYFRKAGQEGLYQGQILLASDFLISKSISGENYCE